LVRRDQTTLARRVAEAGVDPAKTLAGFDFSAVPELDRGLVADLATATFVARADNVILAGSTGVGRSHLMNGLVVEAVKRGRAALQRPAHRMLAEPQAARAGGTYRRRFHRLATVDVLALDDFGLRPLSAEMAEDLYELIRERYERRALLSPGC
jgi:DNA replication protein DnaC